MLAIFLCMSLLPFAVLCRGEEKVRMANRFFGDRVVTVADYSSWTERYCRSKVWPKLLWCRIAADYGRCVESIGLEKARSVLSVVRMYSVGVAS